MRPLARLLLCLCAGLGAPLLRARALALRGGADRLGYYARLGVAEDASAEDIRRAYRQKSKTAHPDKGGTEEVFKKLGEAYTALSAPARRRDYDAAPPPPPPAGRRAGAPRPRRDERVFQVALAVSLEELLAGTRRAVAGSVVIMPGVRLGFYIPEVVVAAGSRGGDVVAMSRQEYGPVTFTLQHVLVEQRHRRFTRRGDDLHLDFWLQSWFDKPSISVRGLDSVFELRVPSKPRNGLGLRAAGAGMPRRDRSGSRGDVIVTLRIRSPRASVAMLAARTAAHASAVTLVVAGPTLLLAAALRPRKPAAPAGGAAVPDALANSTRHVSACLQSTANALLMALSIIAIDRANIFEPAPRHPNRRAGRGHKRRRF